MTPDIYSEYLLALVTPLVHNPEEIVIDRVDDERGILLKLSVAQSDMGLVIGRGGSAAKAIRELLRVIGGRNNAHIALKINDPFASGEHS